MPDGEPSVAAEVTASGDEHPCVAASTMVEPLLSPSEVNDQVEPVCNRQYAGKDPRKIARKYQLDLCRKALEENIIVYLGTGCGKTHIAVLLMCEMSHLIRKPQKNICVFLAPTVALVEQQAKVVEDSTDFKVGVYCGSSKRLRCHSDWDKEIGQYEVLVMTPQILLHNLSHCFIKMDMISLLIFDECHHAQAKSNHPYAEIMKVFYKPDSTKVPRIFGMTASPVVGKGASSEAMLAKSINSLEHMLNAKVYTVELEYKEELDAFVASPVVKIYNYDPISNATASLYETYYNRLAEIKQQCIATLKSNAEEHQKQMNTKKLLNRMHDNMVFCLDNLGIWGALQASQILLSGGHSERNELVEVEEDSTDDSLCDKYLDKAAEFFSSKCPKSDNAVLLDISSVEILSEPLFSKKLIRLIVILSNFRVQSDMKCIIFVNRIVTARSLSYILQKLKFLSQWKSDFLVGVHSGLKNMSRKAMNTIVDKFRSGELNLLVATKVGEEGLDIQTCCLVIRFDLPETVASFIQSRGRARMPQSEYAFLVDRGNKKDLDLIANFKKDEDRMNMEISDRTSNETITVPEEKTFKVDSSGASVSSGYSISLLHQYCSKLPHDEYFDPKPQFFYFDDFGGTICNITLPSNAPIHQICSTPQISTEAAKKDACLKAIEELHKLGALSDYLLPKQNDANLEGHLSVSSDSDESEDDGSRGELHEMLIPPAFRQVWRNKKKIIHLNSYYIKFSPCPEDRIYKKFGLFIMTHLPPEAENMEIDLHLAHGRSVMTNLVPFGVEIFYEDQIKMALKFQQMFLKVILDRSEFIPDFVPLGTDDVLETSLQPFYLLLPVTLQDYVNDMKIDWKVVRRCLSSPIFRNPEYAGDLETFPSDIHLQLANGYRSVRDIENSLVYAPHKNLFYFITNVVHEKNGFSLYKDSGTLRYVDHLIKKFSIHLKYPEQPLLLAKPLFNVHNLLHNRKHEDTEAHELGEYFIDLPPELCQLKIIGFSKDIGSSLSLLPSFMHRLGNLLVAVELKNMLLSSFPEAAEVSAFKFLEALTTERCQERFSLERLEVLGDSFLKFAVSRHVFLMHENLDEGNLTKRRSNAVNNSNLLKLATRRNLQVYIRDQPFDPSQFYALGRPCRTVCTEETEESVHSSLNTVEGRGCASEVCCSKNHHWLHNKTIADVVEALVGAFLVESGFKAASAFLTWIGIKVDFQASQVVNVCKESTRFFPLAAHVDLTSLEEKLGYSFRHKGLLLQAFVHPSFNKHGGGCYQRLEFLGDAVLDYLITSYLYSSYPKLKPGQLTDLRSVSVNNKAFAYVAVDRSFDKFLLRDSSSLSEAIEKYVDHIGRQRPVSQEPKCPKALGDVVESCVGAVLIDSGFNLDRAWEIMTSFLDPIMKFSCFQLSPIRDLQELCQCHNLELHFVKTKMNRMFSVEGTVMGKQLRETASATSPNQKEGVRITCQLLFSKLKAQGWTPKSKPLEEVLKSSSKEEAKLIGYDETPVDVTIANTSGHNRDKETPSHNSNPEIRRIRCHSKIPVSQQSQSSQRLLGETSKVNGSDIHLKSTDFSYKGTARSQLYEFCAASYWKPPSFECCNEEGPSHLKLFTYKVNLEMEDTSDMTLECIGKPHPKKKIAQEDAAEGALWFLQKQGYMSRDSR